MKFLQSAVLLCRCFVHFFLVSYWPDPVSEGHAAPLTMCFAWLHERCINLVRSLALDLKAAEKDGPHRQPLG